jgi:polyhydroxybutyrate depolymerase
MTTTDPGREPGWTAVVCRCAFVLAAFGWLFAAQHAIAEEALSKVTGLTAREISTSDGLRTYTAYVPDTVTLPITPLVVVLHGAGGSGETALEQGYWTDAADRDGFILIAPDGSLEYPDRRASLMRNPRTWNSGPESGTWATEAGIDDVGFVARLIDLWVEDGGVDPDRVFVTGFSNGAAMTFRVGAELSGKVAAIAPVANALLVPVDRLDQPVALMMIWGEDDPLNPIAGGSVDRRGVTLSRPGSEATRQLWAGLLQCPNTPEVSVSGVVTRISQTGCADGTEATLVRIGGLGHQWPGGRTYVRWISGPGSTAIDATATILTFFARNARAP